MPKKLPKRSTEKQSVEDLLREAKAKCTADPFAYIPERLYHLCVKPSTLKPWDRNPRRNDSAARKLALLIIAHGFRDPLVVWKGKKTILAGHTRWKAAKYLGMQNVPCLEQVFATKADAEEYAIADNRASEYAEWDDNLLADILLERDDIETAARQTGFEQQEIRGLQQALTDSGDYSGGATEPNKLVKEHGAPPFSVLDARQGYWKQRKEWWLKKGIYTATSRGGLVATVAHTSIINRGRQGSGGSIFDPVLCELMYNWFLPKGGSILDPCAGEAVKGMVAGFLGYKYCGVELRKDQVLENRALAKQHQMSGVSWLIGDSLTEIPLIKNTFDMVFTSPPYYNLEVYSNDAGDGSNKQTYPEFLEWYRQLFQPAVDHLRTGGWLIVKVADVRDKTTGGAHVGFVADNVKMFMDMGLCFYNDVVLVTPYGSAPIRAADSFSTKKLVRVHQNVLIFYKGNPRDLHHKGSSKKRKPMPRRRAAR